MALEIYVCPSCRGALALIVGTQRDLLCLACQTAVVVSDGHFVLQSPLWGKATCQRRPVEAAVSPAPLKIC